MGSRSKTHLAAVDPSSTPPRPDKLPFMRRKANEKSVLDDIMGDPDDFGDICESDADSDGGRWEDTLREQAEVATGNIEAEIKERKDDFEKIPDSVPETNGLHHASSVHVVPCPFNEIGDDGTNNGSVQPSRIKKRYFIIKSLNYHNIEKSIQRGIWATQAMNEPILNEAFESADKVILIFSINMSGHFQGYAEMISPIGRRRANVWSETSWGGTFNVEWIQLYDLPFQKTLHLKNPLNSFKPVKISRDCQELTEEIGEALCALIDEGADKEGNPKRKLSLNNSYFMKKPCIGRSPFNDASYRVAPMKGHLSPVLYPSNFLPSMSFESYYPQATGRYRNGSRSPASLSRNHDLREERMSEGVGGNGAEVPREEDLLNMSYEEYLQTHGNLKEHIYYNQDVSGFPHQVIASHDNLGKASNIEATDIEYANYLANWYANKQAAIAAGCYYGNETIPNLNPASTSP